MVFLAATVTRFDAAPPLSLPARVEDSAPGRLDCPFCEDWTDIVVRDYAPSDTGAEIGRKLFCDSCGGKVLCEVETV